MANMVKALRQNIENYEKRFGDLPPIPKPNNAPEKPPTPPSIEDIYDQLKVPEGVASGIYANTVLITHSATEFCLDFITSFYPRSSVAARIYMAVPQLARVTETLDRSWQQYQQKLAQQREMLAAQAAQAKVLRTPEEVAELNAQISGAPAEVAPTDADRDIDKAPGEEAGDQDASVESKDDDVIVWGKDAKGQGDASADSNEEASNDDPADDDDLSDDDRKADDAA